MMLLVAMLDGARIDASAETPESWLELKQSEDRKRLVMPGCGLRAIARSSKLSTRYFAHHRQADCKIEHGGETPQHLAMKEALKLCINNVSGWHAVVEYAHPSRNWIVDVLAESDNLKTRVAFEVQLSAQPPDKYFARSQRYFDSGMFPVWLVPRGLDYQPTKVPVVVTGFNKSSAIPEDVSDLLDLPASQDFVQAGEHVGSFIKTLLQHPTKIWRHGSPAEQAAQQQAAKERAAQRAAAEAEAWRIRDEADRQKIAELNDMSCSPISAFGEHFISTASHFFVWGSLTSCWKCKTRMLVWDALSPGPGKKWVRIPGLQVKPDVRESRLENHPEIHRAVDAWSRAVRADIPKAGIARRWIASAGRTYSTFICPSCDSPIGQSFISRLRPEKWSLLSGPIIEPEAATPREAIAPKPAKPSTSTSPRRCGLHSTPRADCGYCTGHPEPRVRMPHHGT